MIEAALIVQSILLLVFAVVLLLVVRQVGVLSLRIGPSGSRTTGSGPELGADLSLDKLVAQLHASYASAPAPALLIAFVSPYCGGCQILFPVLRAVAADERHLRVVAIAREHSAVVRSELGRRVQVLEDEDVFERWQVSSTPYCVVLDRSGKVAAKGLAHTGEHIESLLTSHDLGIPTLDHYFALRDAAEHTAIRLPGERELGAEEVR